MAMTGVTHLRHRREDTLSAGERGRVLLARALAVEAEMLFADEPTTALDPGHQLDAIALLRNIARNGTGVVAVLHDLTLAARFCDRLIVLERGRIVADGAPNAVSTDAILAAAFGIAAHRGEVDGQSLLVPWARSVDGGCV